MGEKRGTEKAFDDLLGKVSAEGSGSHKKKKKKTGKKMSNCESSA